MRGFGDYLVRQGLPSRLSVLIRELECQFGVRVFDRTTCQVVLTPQGSELLAVTGAALKTIEDGVPGFSRRSRRRTGE